ncbi:MAG: FAD-dependent oxidoreductase [Myxococcales bacterium]|nr:FAD-dependent oxidoreductase [Myxococcales bacterium]
MTPAVAAASFAAVVVVVGLALALRLALGARARRRARPGARPAPGWLARRIRARLGGYEHVVTAADPRAPLVPPAPRRVAVVGGGLAGIGAAAALCERGVEVVVFEGSRELGGKIAPMRIPGPDGRPIEAEHGFHAFFDHYYNLNRFLDRAGVRRHFARIDDYLILSEDGRRWSFRGLEPTPILNLAALRRRGLFRLRDILFTRARDEMGAFLEYDRDATFAALDQTSFRDFAARAELPPALRLVFATFARAFFADEARLSMAELVKSFHFYFLSHDGGLLYAYPTGDYRRTVTDPIARYLAERGTRIELGAPVDRIGHDGRHFTVRGERFDDVVLATTSVGARAIALASDDLARRAPDLVAGLAALRPSQRYAVHRLWIDRDARSDVPVFVATERRAALDSVSFYHRITKESAAWVEARAGGAVLELHSYALPDELEDGRIRRALLDDLFHYFPELAGMHVVHEHLEVRADFTAFHVGMGAGRPGYRTPVEGLYLAGDWVDLPFPAMLMEAAYSSGLVCANAILERAGARAHRVTSVPPRGILARRKKTAAPALGVPARAPGVAAAGPAPG